MIKIRSSNMNKKWLISFLLVTLAIFSFSSVVSAQGLNPPEERPRYGYVHEHLIAYAAETLDLSVAEIEERLEAGETMAQIALAEGVEDFYAFMQDARAYVREQLVEEGIVIPGWDPDRARGLRGMRGPNAENRTFNGECPYGEPQGMGQCRVR
jgi:hypothetical protein